MTSLLAGCAGEDAIPVSALHFETPLFDNSALKSRFPDHNPVGIFLMLNKNLLRRKQAYPSCTTYLVQNGYMVTNRHCLIDLWGTGRAWPLDDIRIFFKNPSDAEATPVRVRRIVAERFMVPSQVFSPQRSHEANEHAAENFEDWAVLEPYQKAEVESRFGSLRLRREGPRLPLPSDRLAVEVLRVNPPQGDEKAYVLEVVPGTVKRRSVNPLSENFENVLKTVKVVSIEDTRIRQGNSGSPVIFENEVIGMIGLAAAKENWRSPLRLSEDVGAGLIQWFPGADASIDAVNRP